MLKSVSRYGKNRILPTLFVMFIVISGCSEVKEITNMRKDKNSSGKHDYSNHLVREKSPYLQQHAHNPVDWYPWGEEAFTKAKKENKPIFLSIGYSTCHWCHVMEHESFENVEVAKLMNDAFVNIKVDREERPDIDNIYMTVCQMLTQRGGWPLTIIMTPDKEPFFAATYIPPTTKYGRSGMLELIPRIKRLWQEDRNKLVKSATEITEALRQSTHSPAGNELPQAELKNAVSELKNLFDPVRGGFGRAPKFPTPHRLLLLLRCWKQTGDQKALQMVEETLLKMRMGGIYDHIGFGFHRYSTDAHWLVPHFEKMLYDQALLLMAYTEVYQITEKDIFAKSAKEIISYVLRDMTSPEGGFYSAEDADSDGEEGKFYVWTVTELKQVLNREQLQLAEKVFNIRSSGNFHDEASGQASAKNIFHQTESLESLAKQTGISEGELEKRLNVIRSILFKIRKKRIHPLKDTKILTDWNGLMIAAMAKAARVFHDPKYKLAAQKAADFILTKLRNSQGDLMHRFKDGEVAVTGQLDDYSFMIWGLIELYETTFNAKYLKDALAFNQVLTDHFLDRKNGAFFLTADNGEKLLVRPKDIYDGAIPSGNSVMMLNLLRLARITGKPEYETMAVKIGAAFSNTVKRSPSNFAQLLCALSFAAGPTYEIVIIGKPDSQASKDILKALNTVFLPNKVVLFKEAGEESPPIVEIAKFARDHRMIDQKTTVYICENFSCNLPVTTISEMLKQLKIKK